MTWHDHPDASQIVRDNWQRAECFLVAQRAHCIQIRDDEVRHIDRLLHRGFPDDLDAWNRPDSWFVAVILCPGEDTQALTRHVLERGLDPHRFHFYRHPDTNREALRAWADAGLPLDRIDDAGKAGAPLTNWKALHGILGLHLNLQILKDALTH